LLLKECSEQVTQLHIVWECDFQALKKNPADVKALLPAPFEQLKACNQELLDFLQGPLLRPFEKMAVRDGFSAALSEAYALKYIAQPGDSNRCFVLDVSSLFPYIAIHFPMPQGRYFTLLGDALTATAITFTQDAMLLDGSEVIAIVHCRVHPPHNLLHPFVQTEINGLTVGTLCRTCSESASQDDNLRLCQHSAMERSFLSTLSSYEIAYASQLGYRFDFFEMIVYREASFYLRSFLTLLAFEKLRHSNYPREADTLEKQTEHCKLISQQMQFKQIIFMELTPDIVRPNRELRDFFKLCLNVFLGTFGANAEKGTTVEFLEYYQQLLDHVKSDRIVHLVSLTERILQVTLKKKENTPSRSSNVSVSIVVTSLARVVVHQRMQKVTELGGIMLRVSCDAIFFLLDKELELPFELSEAFGYFKEQFTNVEGVVQIGLRNLSILYREEGNLKEHLVASGVMLSHYNAALLSHSKYREQVESMFHSNTFDRSTKLKVVQTQNSLVKANIRSVRKEHNAFNPLIYLRRQYLSSCPYYSSVPYGFRRDQVV
jgi:hypothetical protein